MENKKQYVLKTMDGEEITINEAQENYLRNVESNKLVKLNNKTINTSTIANITEIKQEYRQLNTPPREEMTQARRIKAMESMIKGFEGNFKGRQMPLTAKTVYGKMLNRLERLNNGEKLSVIPSSII